MQNDQGRISKFFMFQSGAFLAHITITVWSIAILVLHLLEPLDINQFEITVLITLVSVFITLIPIYWLRTRGGYLAGILVYVGMLVTGVNAIVEKNYFFSFSLYNLSVILIYLVAIAGVYLNFKAYKQLPREKWTRVIHPLIVSLVVFALTAYIVQANFIAIYEFRSIQIQNRIAQEINGLDTIEEKIRFLVDKGDIPSMVIGIVVDDQLVLSEAFGETSIDTTYSCGSITKMFTATAIMKLYEQGLINIDNDASQYLPFEIHHPEYSKAVTVRDLLTHQSGLSPLTITQEAYYLDETLIDWISQKHGWTIQKVTPHPSIAEYLEGLLTPGGQYYSNEVWLSVAPGTEHQYSNTNYLLLATLIEHVTGKPYSEYMQENIFDPLEMNSSGFDYTEFGESYATGYEREYGLLSKTNLAVPEYKRVPGPGGLITTVNDLSRFLIAQLNQEQDGNNRILTSNSIDMMHRKAVDSGGHINKIGYGLGFTHLSHSPWQFYGHFYGMKGAIGHEGGQLGYSGAFYFVKEEMGGYGFILLTNYSTIEKDVDFTWYFPTYYQINVLLMEEAANKYIQQNDR